jgi:hypothetical protein
LQGAASAAEIGSIIVCPEHKFKLQFKLKLFISVVSSLTCGHIHALFLFELECKVSSFRALLISSFIAVPHFLLNFYVYESSNTENIGFDKKNNTRANKKNKLENQNQGKNKKNTKRKQHANKINKKKTKTNRKLRKLQVLFLFFVFFLFFCFCFFLVTLPVALFFW